PPLPAPRAWPSCAPSSPPTNPRAPAAPSPWLERFLTTPARTAAAVHPLISVHLRASACICGSVRLSGRKRLLQRQPSSNPLCHGGCRRRLSPGVGAAHPHRGAPPRLRSPRL